MKCPPLQADGSAKQCGGNKNWTIYPSSQEAFRIASEFNIHPAIASVILRRGLKTSAEISRFLNPSIETLKSPFEFSDMRKAVGRVQSAIANKEKILIYGDYDVDGITGCAILYPVLKKLDADTEVYIPHRLSEGYGLNQEALERLLKKKFQLLITVDNGITGYNQIKFLADKKIDTIIVDHHLPREKVPPAFAIVSAAIDQKEDAHLAACGLAFKLGWALLGNFQAMEDSLDLVALGTIADIAPVVGENRILLRHAMPFLAGTKRVGLRALMNQARITYSRVSTRDIAFGLGPRINASGRMGSPENAFKLLTTPNEIEAQNLAQILEEGNRQRQQVESSAFEEALEQIEMDELSSTHGVLVLDSPEWHEGVLGIVASRIVDRYQKPSIVISRRAGLGKGSGRSIPSFSLFDSVLKCENLLETFGGHAQACGLTIREENIPLFRKRLNEVVGLQVESSSADLALAIDAEVPLAEINPKFLQDLEKLEPFGPGNKKPSFVSRNIRLKGSAKKRGKDTLQAWITDSTGKTTCEMVGFRKFNRWIESNQSDRLDIVHQPSLRDYNGIRSIQLELEDWSASR